MKDQQRRDRIAQWAFDCRPVLGRFHIWLEDVEERWVRMPEGTFSFPGPSLGKALIMSAAVTALGTRLFGRYGEAKGLDKPGTNRVKKDADAASAYAMSEGLWYLTRNLPENHAILVSLGEGLMPKGGETPDMGSNPLLGFGRVYARPQVARFLDGLVQRLINDPAYGWPEFERDVKAGGITIWGAAIDTLENTSRFARGNASGPLTVLHLFDQPLKVCRPYEGYVGNLALPTIVVEKAAEHSLLVDFLTPRALVMEAILETYPGLERQNVHVWTLGGSARRGRIGAIWDAWDAAGAHRVDEGWMLPSGLAAFTESGTYAPTYRVGDWTDEAGTRHVFVADGYSATAEAIQAASLDPVLGNTTSMVLLSSRFEIPVDRERHLLFLDTKAADFAQRLSSILGREASEGDVREYREAIDDAGQAGLPVGRRTVRVDDFFPNKGWRVFSLAGYMLPDPYSGQPGVEQVETGVYRVAVRAAAEAGMLEVILTLRLMESFQDSRLIFSPLLDRFYGGQDYRTRPVKVSDSGRIRNELQTLCSEALTYEGDGRIHVHFDRVDEAVLSADKKALIREVLAWYKASHPVWFEWLEVE